MSPFDPTFVLAMMVSWPLMLIAILAIAQSILSRHRSASEREHIYECSACGHVYTFFRKRPLDRCPRCGTLNEAM